VPDRPATGTATPTPARGGRPPASADLPRESVTLLSWHAFLNVYRLASSRPGALPAPLQPPSSWQAPRNCASSGGSSRRARGRFGRIEARGEGRGGEARDKKIDDGGSRPRCCGAWRATPTHGGGRATSATRSPNGSTTIFKVILVSCPCVATAHNNTHVNYPLKRSQNFLLIIFAFHIIFF
jgi:hypothetical protein